MTSRLRTLLITSFFVLAPTVLHASSCIDIVQKIDADLTKYTSTFKDHKLTWANLSWLQHKLGHSKKTNMPGNLTQYEWRCSEDTATFVAVQAGKDGDIVNVNGQYNSPAGSNIFSSAAAAPAPAVASNSSQSDEGSMVTDPAMKAACLQVIKEMMSICRAYGSNVATGVNVSAYEWESMDWLMSNLGTIQEQTTSRGSRHYTWRCNENEKVFVPGKGRRFNTLAESCDASGCQECVIEREKGKIHAMLLHTPPKKN